MFMSRHQNVGQTLLVGVSKKWQSWNICNKSKLHSCRS